MDQVFARNAALVRARYPLSFEMDRPSLESLRTASLDVMEGALALTLLLLASPVLLLCALAIKLSSRGGVFYRQERVGKGGQVFPLYKLRTMAADAEAGTGPVLAQERDPRVTRVGAFLRKTHLDELPQLWNVVRGEMALVGPRPERPFFVNRFRAEVPNYRLRERVKPGITGFAQVCCGYHASPEQKLEFDLLFIQHRYSLAMYLSICWYTARKVLLARSLD